MKIYPLADRIVATRVEADETTPGGIVIPGNAKEKPLQAIVRAVGPGLWSDGARRPMSLKEGDRILVGKYMGAEVKIDGQEMLVLREDEVLAVLT